MTTLKIDDELGRRARTVAATKGMSLDEFVGQLLSEALATGGCSRIERNGLKVMLVPRDTPSIDEDRVRQLLQEQGF